MFFTMHTNINKILYTLIITYHIQTQCLWCFLFNAKYKNYFIKDTNIVFKKSKLSFLSSL